MRDLRHYWRETLATLSLAVWTFVLLAYLIAHLIGWTVGPITDWHFVTPITS